MNLKKKGSSHELIIKIILVVVVILFLFTLLKNSGQTAKENLQGNSPTATLKNIPCEAKKFFWQSDTDKDGVPDSCDICYGKSEKDIDGDGVPDACDKDPKISGTFESDCILIISKERGICGPEP